MDGYKLTREFERLDHRTSEWRQIRPLLRTGEGLLDWDEYRSYAEIDPENARLRSLLAETVDMGLWKLLWLPPSLPYYGLGEPFSGLGELDLTKRLVFSAWNVVPKAIASLASYEAERRMMTMGGESAENSPEARRRIKPLLQVKRSGTDLSGLSTLILLYPSPTLARLGDPLEIARAHRSNGTLATCSDVLAAARGRIETQLAPLTIGAPTEGREDERWYWITPLLLDQQNGEMDSWLSQPDLTDAWSQTDDEDDDADGSDDTAFADGLRHARALAAAFDEASSNDESSRLAGSPATSHGCSPRSPSAHPPTLALRAIGRVTGRIGSLHRHLHSQWRRHRGVGVRRLFNLTDVMTLIRGMDGEGPYWRQVLRYCIAGDLQSTLDEYAHVLHDWLGIIDGDHSESAAKIAAEMQNAIGLRSAGYTAREVMSDGSIDVQHSVRSNSPPGSAPTATTKSKNSVALRACVGHSTLRSGHSCSPQRLSGRRAWTSTCTATPSFTGTSRQTLLISSNAKVASIGTRAMRFERTSPAHIAIEPWDRPATHGSAHSGRPSRHGAPKRMTWFRTGCFRSMTDRLSIGIFRPFRSRARFHASKR